MEYPIDILHFVRQASYHCLLLAIRCSLAAPTTNHSDRFVTGLLDSEQKLRTKRSMNSIAQELGMPLAYVDLRHQVTHEDMPSLAILRHATQRSLTWLWDYYWRRLDQPLRKAEEGAEEVAFRESVAKLREHFRDILRRFVRQEIEATKDQATATSVAGTTRSKRKKSANPSTDDPALQTCQKLIGVCRGKEGMLQELVAVLVEEKIMIPAARKLDDPMDRIFSLWDTLLQHLTRHQSPFLNLLARELILQTNSSSLDVPYCEAAQLWLLHIFTNKSWRTAPLSSLGSQSTLSHSSQRYLLDRRLDLNGVIASCMAPRPSLYNRKVIQSLMEDEVYGAQIKNDWGDIVDVAEKWMF
ncbi:MAG: Eukaryotic translation initiation factor 2B, subunit 4 delta, 67kDa [Chaenotheca gracillima]|nr:MAG: Eukaryotic translation initiation factor 2B, subunit 4 delta, 67kDa [Chaenotheca gracillima]